MSRMYETIFILQPELADDEVKEITSRVEQIVSSMNGELKQLSDWGIRKLAYPINKVARGKYFYMRLDGGADMIAEVERRLRLSDKVLRYQSVKLDKDTAAPVKGAAQEEAEAPAAEASTEETQAE